MHQHRTRRIFLLTAAATCLAACPGGGALSASAEPVALEAYCEKFAEMTCAVAASCSCLDGIPLSYCHSFQHADCVGDVEEPVSAGRRGYDAALAGECLLELEAIISDCSLDDAYWPAACDAMLPPRVAAGGACESNGDCLGGLDCHEELCAALPTEGLACLSGGTCADDHFCDAANVCRRERGPGQPCPEGGVACADGLYCNPLDATCEPYLLAGQACAHATYACASELYCSPATSTCRPYPGLNEDCIDASGSCRQGLFCDAGGTCRSEFPAGGSCAESSQCQSGSCVANVCEPPSEPDACPFL